MEYLIDYDNHFTARSTEYNHNNIQLRIVQNNLSLLLHAHAYMISLSHDTPPLLSYRLNRSGGRMAVPVREQVLLGLGICTG